LCAPSSAFPGKEIAIGIIRHVREQLPATIEIPRCMVGRLGMVPCHRGGDPSEMSKTAKKPPARRNPHARELANGAYRQRVVKDKRRQERKPVEIDADKCRDPDDKYSRLKTAAELSAFALRLRSECRSACAWCRREAPSFFLIAALFMRAKKLNKSEEWNRV
jgi:hypothetical protein